jgi:O-antigen ligase
MDKVINKITIFFYLSLASFPLMRANINSIFIIFCCLFAIYDFLKNKKKFVLNTKIIGLTSVFWMFLFKEIVSSDFNITIILLHLPFLILPFLFFFKPDFINDEIKKKSLFIFQISVFIQTIIYLIVFLKKYNIDQLFSINNYKIPLFRTYVFDNTNVEIHPTYFSAFLLCSFTISLFVGLKSKLKKHLLFQLINICFTLFFISVFVSKIIIIILFFTVILYVVIEIKNKNNILKTISLILFFGAFTLFGFKNLLKERFYEINSEINKPIEGDYHNSINIRVAIIKCSLNLLKKVPILGYGQNLQKKLNDCYKTNNNSNFHTLATYNTHNYYFNLVLYGGWLFLLFFLSYIYYIFFKIKYPKIIIVILIQVLLINSTENFLSRHHGILLFMYFISLFLIPKKTLKNFS